MVSSKLWRPILSLNNSLHIVLTKNLCPFFFLPFSGVKEQTKWCSLYYAYGSSCGDTTIWILSVGDMTHGYKVGFNEATALPPAPDDRRVISPNFFMIGSSIVADNWPNCKWGHFWYSSQQQAKQKIHNQPWIQCQKTKKWCGKHHLLSSMWVSYVGCRYILPRIWERCKTLSWLSSVHFL